jgi:hypothetical protein
MEMIVASIVSPDAIEVLNFDKIVKSFSIT